MANELGELLNAVSGDPDVQAVAKQLALETVAHARYLLANGSPDVRSRIITSLLPTAIQSMKQKQVDEGAMEMRAEFDQMLEEMKGVTDG